MAGTVARGVDGGGGQGVAKWVQKQKQNYFKWEKKLFSALNRF
jgi:hypothetical protein